MTTTDEKNFNFTVARLAKLQAPERGEVQLSDTGEPGLAIRLRSSGAATFIVRYVPAGTRTARRFVIGPVDKMNLEDARRIARGIVSAARAGADPIDDRRRAAKAAIAAAEGGMTLDKLISAYAADRRTARIKTADETERRLRREFASLLRLPVVEITRAQFVAALNKVRTGGGSVTARPGLARKLQANLHGALAFGHNAGVLPGNVMAGYHAPQGSKQQQNIDAERARFKLLTMDEIAALWKACDSPKVSRSFGCYIRSIIVTGARRGEMALSRHSWLHSATPTEPAHIIIPGEYTKNGKQHYLPLPPLAAGVIAQSPRLPHCPYIFPGRRSPKTGDITPHAGFSRMFPKLKKAAEAFGLKRHVTIHDLRRAVKSHYARIGFAELGSVQLNHTPQDALIKIYDIYDRRAERIAAAERWCDEIAAAVGVPPVAPAAKNVVALKKPAPIARRRKKAAANG